MTGWGVFVYEVPRFAALFYRCWARRRADGMRDEEDLRIIPTSDCLNQRMVGDIRNSNSVALHVRKFDVQGRAQTQNVSVDCYLRAIDLIEHNVESPRYFLFSDDPDAAGTKLGWWRPWLGGANEQIVV